MPAGSFFATDLLRDRVVLVTGGGTGIGRAIAIAASECGARVVIASRNQQHLDEGAAVIATASGVPPLTQTCDIRQPEQIAALLATVTERLGPVDALVNNAGGQFPQRAEQYSINGWNAVIRNNLDGTWYMTQAVGRQMIAGGRGGAIVNIIANYHRGIPGSAHTSAARAAVANLTRTLAVEWGGYGIRVNAVAPGPIAASGFTATYAAAVVESARSLPLRRLGSADEIAAGVVFLLSPASAWTTGITLDINGGQHLEGEMWVVDRER